MAVARRPVIGRASGGAPRGISAGSRMLGGQKPLTGFRTSEYGNSYPGLGEMATGGRTTKPASDYKVKEMRQNRLVPVL